MPWGIAVCSAFLFYFLYDHLCRFLFSQHIIPRFFIPLFEEIGKLLSLTMSPLCGVFFTGIFSVQEALTYISKYQKEVGLFKITIARIIAMCFHFCLLAIQYRGWILYRRTNQHHYIFRYFYFAIITHYIWNYGIGAEVFNFLYSLIKG
jgi:RsiW-degrading membrane proteinase PrsW (M82 family)